METELQELKYLLQQLQEENQQLREKHRTEKDPLPSTSGGGVEKEPPPCTSVEAIAT